RVSSNTAVSARASADVVCGAELPAPLKWDAATQRDFREATLNGPVVVGEASCGVRVLRGCRVVGTTGYASDSRTTPHQRGFSVGLKGQARVGLPWVGADLDSRGELQVAYAVAARSYARLAPRT